MTTLNSKLRLQLLANKKPKNIIEKGFTLVELMVTVAVVGVLAAAAFPAYLGAQQKASTGATIGSMQGYAKECATKAITGDTSNIVSAVGAIDGMTFGDLDCATNVTTITSDAVSDPTTIGGLKCGATAAGVPQVANGTAGATGHVKCQLSISTDGVITGEWQTA